MHEYAEAKRLKMITPSHSINQVPMPYASSHSNPINTSICSCTKCRMAKQTIIVRISSSTGVHYLDVLPDSGADISAVGQDVLTLLGQHVGNILPSSISPRTVNGLSIMPLGKVPVTIQLGKAIYKDDLHIYPGVSGALISWKAAKGLGILHPQYPYPGQWSCR